MSDKKGVSVTQYNLPQLTQEEAVDLIQQCEQTPVEDLWHKLSRYITHLKTMSGCCELDAIETFTHIVYKGFYRKSEQANALRYFYWGYFAREQEEIVRTANHNCKMNAIDLISSTKHVPEIMHFLYVNGCSQQREIVKSLCVDKSNLSRLLKVLVNCGLITKISGPKYVFYELTHDGYSYYRQRDLAQHFLAEVPERMSRLQSEAVQMRDELAHLGSVGLPDVSEPNTLHTMRFYVNTVGAHKEAVFSGNISSHHMCLVQTNGNRRGKCADDILPKESKYSAWSYSMTQEW